jgi:multidrug efflux pump subunit AcrA (membrane-fusion protein)
MFAYLRRINFIILILLCFSACHQKNISSFENNELPTEVKVFKVLKENYVEDLNSFGTISYKLKNNITCLQEGQIIYLPYNEGDFIKKGQVIARLKNVHLDFQKEQYENALITATANLEITKNQLHEKELQIESMLISLDKARLNIEQKELELELQKEILKNKSELHEIGGVTDSSLKQLQLSVKSLETDIKILKKELEISSLGYRDQDLLEAGYIIPDDEKEKKKLLILLNTRSVVTQIKASEAEVKNAETSLSAINKLIDELTIISPITGVVGSKIYEIGEYVKENESIATMMDVSEVCAVIYIQEKDIVDYSIGSEIDIEIPSLKKKLKSKITEISPYADPQTGNFSVKAKIDNKDQKIKPGMFIRCNLKQTAISNFYKIPESALINKSESTGSVFCIKNGFAVQQKITIRYLKNGFIWIDSGITDEDYVIDNPSPFLREGQSVKF